MNSSRSSYHASFAGMEIFKLKPQAFVKHVKNRNYYAKVAPYNIPVREQQKGTKYAVISNNSLHLEKSYFKGNLLSERSWLCFLVHLN